MTLLPGELARLPRARHGEPARVVRVLSGTVWLTHGGNDEVLWPGETFRLEPQGAHDARRYGPTLASTLGEHGAAIEMARSEDDASAGKVRGLRSWLTGRQARQQSGVTGSGAATDPPVAGGPTFWNRWLGRSGARPTSGANPCA